MEIRELLVEFAARAWEDGRMDTFKQITVLRRKIAQGQDLMIEPSIRI